MWIAEGNRINCRQYFPPFEEAKKKITPRVKILIKKYKNEKLCWQTKNVGAEWKKKKNVMCIKE